jgi:hypothetical protein
MWRRRKEMREPIYKVINARYSDYPAPSRLSETSKKRRKKFST